MTRGNTVLNIFFSGRNGNWLDHRSVGQAVKGKGAKMNSVILVDIFAKKHTVYSHQIHLTHSEVHTLCKTL